LSDILAKDRLERFVISPDLSVSLAFNDQLAERFAEEWRNSVYKYFAINPHKTVDLSDLGALVPRPRWLFVGRKLGLQAVLTSDPSHRFILSGRVNHVTVRIAQQKGNSKNVQASPLPNQPTAVGDWVRRTNTSNTSSTVVPGVSFAATLKAPTVSNAPVSSMVSSLEITDRQQEDDIQSKEFDFDLDDDGEFSTSSLARSLGSKSPMSTSPLVGTGLLGRSPDMISDFAQSSVPLFGFTSSTVGPPGMGPSSLGASGTSPSTAPLRAKETDHSQVAIKFWFPVIFFGFDPSIIEDFVNKFREEGFVSAQDLLVAKASGQLATGYLESLGLKLGHQNRLMKSLDALR
jgi:hypothetical protein